MAPDAETLSKAEAKTARRRACAFDSMKRKASRMRGRILKPLVTTALLALLTWASAASAEETVTFRSAAGGLDIRGYLAKPEGRGPFPAIVLLHSCLGLPANRQSIETEVTGWGYVALFVDDFSARGLKETCAVDFPEGASDAYGALAFLAKLAYVEFLEDRRSRLLARGRHGARDRGVRAKFRLRDPGRPHVQSRGGFLSALRQPRGRGVPASHAHCSSARRTR